MYPYFTVYMYSYYYVPDMMNLTRLSPTKTNTYMYRKFDVIGNFLFA